MTQTVTEASREDTTSRLQTVLDLLGEEIQETVGAGNARAYSRAERLLAIAQAVRRELITGPEDLLEGAPSGKIVHGGQILLRGEMTPEEEDAWGVVPRTRSATSDMRREQELAQIEAAEARRRRDDGATRVSQLEEIGRIQKLLEDWSLPKALQDALRSRQDEITRSIAGSVIPVDAEAAE